MALEATLTTGATTSRPVETVRTGDKLEVLFRNTGATRISFVIGGSTGVGPMHAFGFTSTRPDGGTCKLLNATVAGVGGAVVPIIVHLEPGSVDRVYVDLRKLICTASGDSSADKLLRAGHSIRATFSGTAEGNSWGGVQNGWTGQVSSGPLAIDSSGR